MTGLIPKDSGTFLIGRGEGFSRGLWEPGLRYPLPGDGWSSQRTIRLVCPVLR